MADRIIEMGKVGIISKGNWDSNTQYENLDVVSFNGHRFISGPKVPIGVSPINSEYWTQLTDLSGAKIIFMPIAVDPAAISPRYASECIVIISKTGKVLMIDSGKIHSRDLIIAELEKNNITHIDYFILTHYHPDHADNIWYTPSDDDNFVTKYMDSTTKAYLPWTGRSLGFAWKVENGISTNYVSSKDSNNVVLKNYTINNNVVTNILPHRDSTVNAYGWYNKWSRLTEERVISSLQSKGVKIYPEEVEAAEAEEPSSINAGAYTLVSDSNIVALDINTDETNENNDLQEYEDFEFDGIKIQFLNTRKKDFKYYIYAAPYTTGGSKGWTVNNLSIVNRITIGETTCLMTGDIEYLAEQYLYGDVTATAQMYTNYMSNDSAKQQTYLESSERIDFSCDILKVPHHMQEGETFQDFYLRLHPKIAIVTTTFEYSQKGSMTSSAARYLNYINTPVYIVGGKPTIIGITTNSYTAYTTSPPFYAVNNRTFYNGLNLYVDSAKAEILRQNDINIEPGSYYADGSKRYPYTNLRTAIAHARNFNGSVVTINIIGSYTDTAQIYVDSVKPYLTINGNENVSLGQIYVRNSSVRFDNLTCTATSSVTRCISFEFSTGIIQNCTLNGNNISSSTGLYTSNSNIVITNSTISNTGVGIEKSNSLVKLVSMTLSNNNTNVVNSFGSSPIIRTDSVSYNITSSNSIGSLGTKTANLYTLINNNLPSGCHCLGVCGFASSNAALFVMSAYYENSEYSLKIKNSTSNTVTTGSIVIYYLYM